MPEKDEKHALLDVALTVLVPTFLLDWGSETGRLGPFWALIAASAIPLLFGVYRWWKQSGIHFFSLFGLAAVVLTGGMGLLKLDAFWVGIKESAFPVLMGLLFPLSHTWRKPLVKELLMQPAMINVKLLEEHTQTPEAGRAMHKLLWRCSWMLCGTMLMSAVINQFMAMAIVGGTEPGSVPYNQALAKLNWVSMLGIGIPMMLVLAALFFWFLRRLSAISGLDQVELTTPGRTVRRRVD
jgi:intracellular septation protein A